MVSSIIYKSMLQLHRQRNILEEKMLSPVREAVAELNNGNPPLFSLPVSDEFVDQVKTELDSITNLNTDWNWMELIMEEDDAVVNEFLIGPGKVMHKHALAHRDSFKKFLSETFGVRDE
jgi:hypothetical protein